MEVVGWRKMRILSFFSCFLMLIERVVLCSTVSGRVTARLRMVASIHQYAPTKGNLLPPPAVGLVAFGSEDLLLCFPPFRQKKGERMGHPVLRGGLEF